VQQIERDCFSVAKRRSIYDVNISGFTRSSIYIQDISSLRVNGKDFRYTSIRTVLHTPKICCYFVSLIPHKLRAQFYDRQKI